jgi:hypothetical protein
MSSDVQFYFSHTRGCTPDRMIGHLFHRGIRGEIIMDTIGGSVAK